MLDHRRSRLACPGKRYKAARLLWPRSGSTRRACLAARTSRGRSLNSATGSCKFKADSPTIDRLSWLGLRGRPVGRIIGAGTKWQQWPASYCAANRSLYRVGARSRIRPGIDADDRSTGECRAGRKKLRRGASASGLCFRLCMSPRQSDSPESCSPEQLSGEPRSKKLASFARPDVRTFCSLCSFLTLELHLLP